MAALYQRLLPMLTAPGKNPSVWQRGRPDGRTPCPAWWSAHPAVPAVSAPIRIRLSARVSTWSSTATTSANACCHRRTPGSMQW